jgi:hypothetical protein
MSVMTVGINPFWNKEGGYPFFEGSAIRIAGFDQDLMRHMSVIATCRHELKQQKEADHFC